VSTTASRISQINLVMIPSTDQDRSIEFYEVLGFEKRSDFAFGEGYRWVELYPPSGTAGIALAPGAGEATGVQTGIILTTDDIDATHAQLQSTGIDVDAAVAREGAPVEIRVGAAELVGPVPPMFYVRDPDGNALLIVEPSEPS
jgi:catechol 2,3-dioxygenase-like lactoylglutathione lyase family enzyme